MNRCACGRPVNAGRTSAHGHERRCLICETAQLFAHTRLPPVDAEWRRRFFKRETANDKIDRLLKGVIR